MNTTGNAVTGNLLERFQQTAIVSALTESISVHMGPVPHVLRCVKRVPDLLEDLLERI